MEHGIFSDSSKFYCIACGKQCNEVKPKADEENFTDSLGGSTEIESTIFDGIDPTESTQIIIEINKKNSRKEATEIYTFEYLEDSKIVLADFSELNADNITKSFLEAIYSISNNVGAEELFVAISLVGPDKNLIVRNLLVYGFEVNRNQKFSSSEEVMIMGMEVNQEYDYVDLI